jgi:predicted DNA-binding protein (UPF0251 family)
MNTAIKAVITGDMVKSTTIEEDYREQIQQISNDIRARIDTEFQSEIFRGDSFQGVVSDPAKGLLIGILFRTGLRRFSRNTLTGADAIWDARISVGIGGINTPALGYETRIGQQDGEAFMRSGMALDGMKQEKSLLTISTGDRELDSEFNASCAMADAIISRWSNEQSEAIYLYLLENLTQKEIGARLGISQRAAGKRLEIASLESIKKFLDRSSIAIEWKYNN